MKILLSAFACEPHQGSEAGNGWAWAHGLAQAGFRVWVITTADGRPAIERHLATEPEPNLTVIVIPKPELPRKILTGQLGYYVEYWAWQQCCYRTARKLHQSIQFDLVHHVTWGSLQLGSPLWRLGRPFLFGPVGGGQVAPPRFKDYFETGWRLEQLRTFVVTYLTGVLFGAGRTVREAATILVSNSDTARLVRRLGGKDARVFFDTAVPTHFLGDRGVPPAHVKSGRFEVLWVGRLLPRKAVRLALEAIAQVDRSIPLRLTILGGGPMERFLPGWIEQLNLADRVSWRGQVAYSEVLAAYRISDVFLFTSLRDSTGSQLIEAMAFGLPIVTLDHHGAHDFVPDTAAIKVPVTEPATAVRELAAALTELWRDPARLHRMGANSLAFAQDQTWDKVLQRAIDIYRKVIPIEPTSLQTSARLMLTEGNSKGIAAHR
jgi:glycosyltransferase involved in cell wall biosynthesis